MIASSVSRSVARSVAQAIASIGAGGGNPFEITPSTETPVAGVDVTWTTNAGDLGTPVSYYWDFGDGTIPGSGASIPAHYYVGPGPYTSTFIVTFDDDSTATDTQVITLQTTEEITKINKPYTAGTSYDLSTFTGLGATFTANTATAPDGTTTAGTITEDTANTYHLIYITPPAGLGTSGTYHVVFYAKTVDMEAIGVTIYNSGSNDCALEINLSTGAISQGTGLGAYPLVGSSAYPVPDAPGWTRIAMSLELVANPTLMWISAGKLGVAYDANGQSTYLGTSKSCYIWGLHSGTGVDDYNPETHYLGDVQIPAPTETVNVLREADGQTIEHLVVFSDDISDSNYNTTYDFDVKVGTVIGRVRPVGAKLQAATDVGFHVQYDAMNWALGYDIGVPNTNGLTRQLGMYIYLGSAPASRIGVVSYKNASSHEGIYIESDLTITAIDYLGGSTEIFAGTLPLQEWFWVGVAQLGFNQVLTVRVKDGSTWDETQAEFVLGAHFGIANTLCWGPYNSAGNADHNTRFSGVTYHRLDSLSAAGYPTEIVRPQEENHIYRVDPVSGDDTGDGVTTPWQSITRVNTMLVGTSGILSVAPVATTIDETGKGSWLVIDTSVQRFDVGVVGLVLNTDSMWIKPVDGETYVDFQAEVLPDPGDWTVTGGYTGIYETPINDDDTRVFQDNIYHAPVADLTALDAALAGASCVVANVLYIKPYGGTDPRSDGKTYAYGRIRPDYVDDPVGRPVVNLKSSDLRITGVKTNITAVNNGGSYAIGDTSGFSGKALVENFDCRRADKHAICYTIDATNSEIVTQNGFVDQGLSQLLTDYMGGGASFYGNTHRWINVDSLKGGLLARSADGTTFDVYYSHGGGSLNYTLIEVLNCDWADNGASWQYVAASRTFTGSTLGAIIPASGACTIATCVLKHIPSLLDGSSLTTSTITPVDVQLTTARTLGGTVSITNNNFDLRDFLGGFSPGLWLSSSLNLTFTGNTVRFGNTGNKISCPIFKDMQTSDIVSCNNNPYYIGASDVFAKDFDAGGGAADYTFAQWQALGYDAASSRIDP